MLNPNAFLRASLLRACLFAGMATAVALSATPASAARFANQFVEFELPANWQCNLEGAEWVCQSTEADKKRDAIIVLAAKLKGDQDSLDQYLAYLKAAKSYTSVQGKPVKSDPKYAKLATLNGESWVDSLHLESEMPGFYTRYLATVKQDIGALVTYSVNKDKFQQYVPDFERLVSSLRVFRKQGGLPGPQGDIFKQAAVPPAVVSDSTVFRNPIPGGNDAPMKTPVREEGLPTGILMAAALGVGAILIIKRRRG